MDIEKTVLEIAKKARAAALKLANVSSDKKNLALKNLASLLRQKREEIKAANLKDLAEAQKTSISKAMLERLSLDDKKIESIAISLEELAALPDYVGEIMESITRPNGLKIEKVRVPIGVIAIIYESRPNVTIDCAALCLKSSNACILRGGSESFNTNIYFAGLIKEALKNTSLHEDCVQIIPTTDRQALSAMLKQDSYINCIIPRGGEGLIRHVVENSSIPVLKHYKGVCNVFIDEYADETLAINITVDAKCQRPSVCNAAENLLVHKNAKELLVKLARKLASRGVELRTTNAAKAVLDSANIPSNPATPEDFQTEYTDLIIAIDLVDDVQGAIDFINLNSSGHSDCIVTSNAQNAEDFLNGVDSATVYWNASTRFTDGFEFGMGAEIGISTDKLHSRGPMGLKELNIYKYKIRGTGQTKAKVE